MAAINLPTQHWLNIHPGANFSHLTLLTKQLGINFNFTLTRSQTEQSQ